MNTLTDDDFISPCGHINGKISALKALISANKTAFAQKSAVCSDPRCNKPWKTLWMCCTCGKFFCGYADNKHATTHNLQEKHAVFFHLTQYELWCYDCNYYRTTETWKSTIRALTSITKEKASKPDQTSASASKTDALKAGDKAGDADHRSDLRPTSRQTGKVAVHKPKGATLGNVFLRNNEIVQLSQSVTASLQQGTDTTADSTTMASAHRMIKHKCFAKVPIHSHANTCYLNSILQILAHLSPFAQYFVAMQPILLSTDAGNYTYLLHQFTLVMIALQLVTDASVPPFFYALPDLSAQKLNIESLSIALFGFLNNHLLGDFHDAHEIQTSLFNLLGDGLQFVHRPRQHIITNIFPFMLGAYTRNRGTMFSIFGRSYSEKAIYHLREREVLVTSPYFDDTTCIDMELLSIYNKVHGSIACDCSKEAKTSSRRNTGTCFEALRAIALHPVLTPHCQLSFMHQVNLSPAKTDGAQDSSQAVNISHRLRLMFHTCSFFDYMLDHVRFTNNKPLTSPSQALGGPSSANAAKYSTEDFGSMVEHHTSTVYQILKYSNTKPLTLLTQCFRGISQTIRKCSSCESYKTRYETFCDLLVPYVPDKTFLEEFSSMFAEEICKGVYCDVCATETQGSTHLSLYYCPEILIALQKRGPYDTGAKQVGPHSQLANSPQGSANVAQLTALSSFSLIDSVSPDSPHKKFDMLMGIDTGSDFRIQSFLQDFIRHQAYRKLAQEIVIILYELVLKSTGFFLNNDVIQVIAVMEYVLRRFKAARVINASSHIRREEIEEVLNLLGTLPTGINLKMISPNSIEYLTVLLSEHMFYALNVIIYTLLLLAQNRLMEVERALERFNADGPGILEFLQRQPVERQSGRTHLLYLLFATILSDIHVLFANFKLSCNYKSQWTTASEQDDIKIQNEMKNEFRYSIHHSKLYHLYLHYQKEYTDKFYHLFSDIDVWKAGAVNYELSSFIVHCNGNHYVAYIKSNSLPDSPDTKSVSKAETSQGGQGSNASSTNLASQQITNTAVDANDQQNPKQQSGTPVPSAVPSNDNLTALSSAPDAAAQAAASSAGVWYCFNDDKITRTSVPPIGDASILYFTKAKTPIVEALKKYLWAELCSVVQQSSAEPEWMHAIMTERATCLELLEILLGSHDLLDLAFSSMYLTYDLSPNFVYALHNLHWPSLDRSMGHINTRIRPLGPWRVSSVLSHTIQPAQLAQRYPVLGSFYYCISAIFDGSLTDYLERDASDLYPLKVDHEQKINTKVDNERALYNCIMAKAASVSMPSFSAAASGYLVSVSWLELWGAHLFNDRKRPLAFDNSALLAVDSNPLNPVLRKNLCQGIDYLVVDKQEWTGISALYPSKVGHELPTDLLIS